MEDIDQNPQPQPTGGLKLMTVFIAVLALHVVVIGGFTVWHVLYPASSDADVALDKAHKNKVVTDGTIGESSASDTASTDKMPSDNPTAPTSGTDAAGDTITSTTPASAVLNATSAPATASTIAPTPSATPVPTAINPPGVQPPPSVADDVTAPVTAPATPAAPIAAAPSGPIHHGPVVSPADNLEPPADNAPVAVTTPAPAADATAATTNGTPYAVKKGDSLAKIAKRHHVALDNLRMANNLTNDSLHIGQKLIIPSGKKTVDEMAATSPAPAATPAPAPARVVASTADTTTTPTTTPTESADVAEAPDASSTAAPAPVAKESLAAEPRVTTTATPKHHAKLVAAASHASHPSHHFYTVVKGDTLTKIAKRYHTTTSAIVAANGLTNAGRLSIGQKLHIPAHEHEAHAAATASEEAAPAEETAPRTSAKGQLANYVQ